MTKKKYLADDVYEAAIERINILFDRYDTVVVSFSGGKDSTVCLNLTLEVARARKRLPLEVYFFDEEAVHPETEAYVERVASLPDIRMQWLCLPLRHRNACSRKQPYWYPWNPDEKAIWVRELPARGLQQADFPRFVFGATIPQSTHTIYGPEYGTIADVRGIRAAESLRRLQSVTKKKHDNWIAGALNGYIHPTSPIYDWSELDVWVAPRLWQWDYNRAYDLMYAAGIPFCRQRVCPPFGEEPLENLWMYRECWPDLWHKMVKRVHGAATAARYSKSELYAYGKTTRPPGLTWKDWTYALIELYGEEHRASISANVKKAITIHKNKTNRPIPDDEADPASGLSWKFLAMIANRGDLKGRRLGKLVNEANNTLIRRKLTLEEVMDDADAGTRY
jgi:predicted phosphoadenosine phosphosulfate sulfurtransferase